MAIAAADIRPKPFFEVRVRDLENSPALTAVCAGFERGEWRGAQMARHLFEWLPEFALPWSEIRHMHAGTAARMLRRAAQLVYTTEKFQRRGEFGELLLHAILRREFGTEPAVSKLFYKDAANDTVKGFDAVHVVATDVLLELWLGEAKLYGDVSDALSEAAKSLTDHLEQDYLSSECVLIANKLDPAWPYAERLANLLDENTTLDAVFDALRIPVLVTYDSSVMKRYTSAGTAFLAEYEEEVQEIAARFSNRDLPTDVSVDLVLLPLPSKEKLLEMLDQELRIWQQI